MIRKIVCQELHVARSQLIQEYRRLGLTYTIVDEIPPEYVGEDKQNLGCVVFTGRCRDVAVYTVDNFN